MSYVWTSLFLLVLLGAVGLNVFSMPGNWALLGLAALYAWLVPDAGLGWGLFVLIGSMALIAEILEFLAQYIGAKRYGASAKGNIGGLIGALAGAVLGAPFFLGLGALLGAVAGAFAGCFLFERSHGKSIAEAKHAAWGAMYGKIFGLVTKIVRGVAMWAAVARDVWP